MPVYNKYTQFIFLHRKVSVYCLEYSKWWKNSPRTLSRRLALVWAYELQLSISPATPKLSRGIRPDFCLSYSPSTKRMMNCVSPFRVLRVFALPSFTSSEVQASSAPFTSQHCQNFLPHLVSWAIFFLMSTGEIRGSILSLLQLLTSLEPTSACIWRLPLILRALTNEMLDTHHSGGVQQHRPTKGRTVFQM